MEAEQKGLFHHKERVRWIDTDASQRIHFAAVFRFFEIAEQEFLQSLGVTYKELDYLGVDVPRVNVECNYTAPIMNHEMLDIEVRVERVGNSSVTLGYIVWREDGAEAVNGRMTFCTVDTQTGRSTPLPEKLRQALLSATQG